MYRRTAVTPGDRSRSPSPQPSNPTPTIKPNLKLTGSKNDYSSMQSRLHNKTLASPAKIWGLLAVILILFLLTRAFTHQSPAHSLYNRDTLHPRNYLNASASAPAPFDFCPVHGPGDAIGQKYGVHLMSKSRIHTGSGARIHRVIHKALSGQPVTISVLGGSSEYISIWRLLRTYPLDIVPFTWNHSSKETTRRFGWRQRPNHGLTCLV
jgi:hypothetical protein